MRTKLMCNIWHIICYIVPHVCMSDVSFNLVNAKPVQSTVYCLMERLKLGCHVWSHQGKTCQLDSKRVVLMKTEQSGRSRVPYFLPSADTLDCPSRRWWIITKLCCWNMKAAQSCYRLCTNIYSTKDFPEAFLHGSILTDLAVLDPEHATKGLDRFALPHN